MLVTVGEEVFIRDGIDSHVVAGPVLLNSEIRFAAVAAEGQVFIAATRDGRFRVWRSADATPLCAEAVFDPAPARANGNPTYDYYPVSVWAEVVEGRRSALRRLAFQIESNNAPEKGSGGFRVFDLGFSSNARDHKRFGDLVERLFGVRLSEEGSLTHSPPSARGELESTYLAPAMWESEDFRVAAEWLLRSRFAGQASPFTSAAQTP